MKEVAAYIPCFNNEGSIGDAIESVRGQTIPIGRLLVLDDGSTDRSVEAARGKGAEVLAFPENRGRGFIRARAMERLDSELIACCDATNALDPTFVERALPLFDDPEVAAVYGDLSQGEAKGVADRWRDRHLFKPARVQSVTRSDHLATWGAVVRRSAALEAGNFDADCRHSEDRELGARLLSRGLAVYASPDCRVYSTVRNSPLKTLERYWRWNAGEDERFTARDYFKRVSYAARVLAARDLADGDAMAAAMSLLAPQYALYKALLGRQNRR